MNKLLLLLAITLFSVNASADSLDNQHAITIRLLEEKVNNFQQQIERSETHLKDLLDAKKAEVEKVMDEKEDALSTRMIIYCGFFVLLIGFAAWFLNWLGKREIRNIVAEIATAKVDEELKLKLSNEVIDQKLSELGKPAIIEMLKDLTNVSKIVKQDAIDLAETRKKYEILKNEVEELKANFDASNTPLKEKEKVKEFNEVAQELKEEKDFSAEDWYWKGAEATNEGDYEQAISNYDESIKLDPKNSSAWNNRGYAKTHLGKYTEAIEDLNESIRLNPKNDAAWNNLGNAKSYIEKHKEAIEDFDECLKLNPKNDTAWNNRGLAKNDLGKYIEAIEDLNESIRLDPKNDAPWNNLGIAKNNLERFDDAITDLNKAIELAPNIYNSYKHRAYSNYKLGNLDLSLKDINKAIELNSDYKNAIKLKEEIVKAMEN